MISPYKNTFRVSQAYRHLRSDGTYHQGYDLVGIGDKHIYSPVYGTVIRAGWECATLPKKGFGQRVVLRVGRTNYYMNTATIITVAIMAVALVVVAACMIRLGYKALLAEWAIEAITKAEKEFVGTKLGEARLAVVVSWLRAKVPAPLRFLVTDSLIRKVVQVTFNAAKAGLEVLKDA